LAKAIPRGTLRIVRGGGHLFLLDQPAGAAPAIETFLTA